MCFYMLIDSSSSSRGGVGLNRDRFRNPFTRLTRRREVHKDMISDNGTSFVGAVTELQELVGQLDKDKIQETTAQKGVMWAFNPPGAPHYGGAHEVMAKAAKKAIHAMLSSSDVTVVTGAESLINSRPLTHPSVSKHLR